VDAPAHTRLRRKLNAGFSPAVLQRLRPRIEHAADRLLEEISAAPDPDLIRDFAHRLPVLVICGLLGIADSLHPRCVSLSDDFAAWFADPMRSAISARKAHAAVSELTEIFAGTVRARALSGAEDLMRLMIEIAREDEAITPEVLHAQCVLLWLPKSEDAGGILKLDQWVTTTRDRCK
jgi:cytochrome P450